MGNEINGPGKAPFPTTGVVGTEESGLIDPIPSSLKAYSGTV